jgi:hypothetical protein
MATEEFELRNFINGEVRAEPLVCFPSPYTRYKIPMPR